MTSVEKAAKTREEAIALALQELGLERHEVEVEILDEGSAGFFGFGARDVRVRVSGETKEEPRREGRRRPARDRSEQRQETRRGGRRDETRRDERRREPRQEKREAKRQEKRESRRDDKREEKREQRREEKPAPAPKPREPQKLAQDTEGRGHESAALLEELIKRMGMEASVTSAIDEEGAVRLIVESSDAAILIGRKGRTLSALEYLINRMAARDESQDEANRIIVDIENYIERRRSALEDMALRLAGRAKESGQRIRMKPLSARERRVIHLTLQDDPDIRTFSVGESLVRSVVIAPKNAGGGDGGRPSRDGGRPPRGDRRDRGGRGGDRSRRGRGPRRGGRGRNPRSDDRDGGRDRAAESSPAEGNSPSPVEADTASRDTEES